MRQDDHITTTELQVCTDCHEPFVAPTAILDVIDDDRCVVELRCANCHGVRVAVQHDDALAELDRRIEEDLAALMSAVEVFEALDEWERAERFIEALHADHVLPEDF